MHGASRLHPISPIACLYVSTYICATEVGLGNFATLRGVLLRRAQAMAESGVIPARKEGGIWLVDERAAVARKPSSRPLSPRMAWAVIEVLSGVPLDNLSPMDLHRGRKYAASVHAAANPIDRLYSLVRRRSVVLDLQVHPGDIPAVAADLRIAKSGISDERSGLSAARELEAYIAEADREAFIGVYLLVESSSPNVRLHCVASRPAVPVPMALVIADLIDWNGPREEGRARELMSELQWNR